MLFNSYPFLLAFLPITLLVFLLLGRWKQPRLAMSWLITASLFFYGWWNPAYVILIVGSILFNFSIGSILSKKINSKPKWLLLFGIISNLSLLAYFKYFQFFSENINFLLDSEFTVEKIILPLAISFFTFQQIAYLVDAYRGETREYNFLHYCLFVTFFPQLIAGPIVHHKEMMPQFDFVKGYRFRADDFSIGFTILIFGLFKKVGIADYIALSSTPVFGAAYDQVAITFAEAWTAALSYTFQLYFDFSGYSDMAIGVARMFGIRLPMNFNSPYKAKSIIEFWRSWHMTLSRFLRDYLYFPLGGNRKGHYHRYLNLFITMLLGGLWHGAGWTFVIWGSLHGVYLIINHSWQYIVTKHSFRFALSNWWSVSVGRTITFIAIVIGWVFFRAADFNTAMHMLTAMFDFQQLWSGTGFENGLVHKPENTGLVLLLLLLIVWYFPNTQQIMRDHDPVLEKVLPEGKFCFRWQPLWWWALGTSILAIIILTQLSTVSEFLYFQF